MQRLTGNSNRLDFYEIHLKLEPDFKDYPARLRSLEMRNPRMDFTTKERLDKAAVGRLGASNELEIPKEEQRKTDAHRLENSSC